MSCVAAAATASTNHFEALVFSQYDIISQFSQRVAGFFFVPLHATHYLTPFRIAYFWDAYVVRQFFA